MNTRGLALVLLTLCVLGGLIAAIFTPAIAATLTLPATPTSAPAQAGLTPTPTASALATEPATQATLPTNGVTVLARDTFQRPNQKFWGSSSDGRMWGSDANTKSAFSIVNHAGQVSGAKGPFQATLNVTNTDAEILIGGSVSWFDDDGDINLGGVLRWQDSRNWYKVLINGNVLQLLKDVDGKTTVLGSVPFHAVGETSYKIRFRVLGSNLFAKAWPASRTEPANWSLMIVDMQLTSGVSGIRVLLAPGAVIRITSFLETSVPTTM